ncbi:DUF2913 family protein (plasmid) [Enterobacter asburiae]|jgi:hypothetical protein|uniref:DUF2913 family protein n=1 Tax=Enterobacter asburiae TaxID=61645 RepID=UPI0029326BB5|nr:DUF2913 family protein [Enterobacter asburiae]EMA4739793.1 DUF2913 family protein [Enterobacter asburiae]
MTLTEKSGHFAWCALVALALAKQDRGGLSPAQENIFLIRWMATALRQRRFTRDITPDITWLLKQGRQLGTSSNLPSKLLYLWNSCTGELLKQNDLFRLLYALERAKDKNWIYRLLSEREWSGRNAVILDPGVNGIYIPRANLNLAFDDDGKQINHIIARLTGNVADVQKMFHHCYWHAESDLDSFMDDKFSLVARKTESEENH